MNRAEKWDYIQEQVKLGKSFGEIKMVLRIPSSTIQKMYHTTRPITPETGNSTNRNSKEYRMRIRNKILEHFGGKCKRCGFSDPRALQLDHVNGGGRKEIMSLGANVMYVNLVKRIEKGEDIQDYQLLCANCNWIKRHENQEHRKY